MEGLGSVVLLLVMGIAWVVGQAVQHIRARRAPVQNPMPTTDEERVEADSMEVTRERVPATHSVQRPASAWRADRLVDIPSAEPASDMRNAARRLVTGRDNLRRAVIIMTVLGPPVSQRPNT